MTNRRTLSLAIIFAVILGVLVYVPVIPHSAPAYAFPAIYTCGGCVTEGISGNPITSHILNSITLQLFNFGGQYSIYSRFFRGSYNFCSFGGCESFWFVGVIYGFLIALAAINVGLIARFLSRRSGMGGASVQIGLGVFALIISPFLQLLNQYFRLRSSALIPEEAIVAGTVLILTGVAELWWFRTTKDYTQTEEELASVEQTMNKA